MNFRNHLVKVCSLWILSLLLAGLFEFSAHAQDNQPLKLDFVGAGAAGPPSVVVLGDGTLIFKLTAFENVTGDLTGTLTEKVTQVYPVAEEGLLPITTSWKLVTAAGTIEGYYSGLFQHMQTGDHMITQQGEVLSVTGEYVNLYQATVQYQAVLLSDHQTISGTLTIHPRERR